jgi:hypothetical protein
VNGSSSSIYYVPVANNAPSTTSLLADVPTAMAGGTVTLTAAVVTPVAGHQPNGQTVTFLDGATAIGTAPLGNPTDFGGGSFGLTAQLIVTTLAGGPHNLIASYAGDAVLTPSDSSSAPVIVSIMDYSVQGAPAALTIKDGQTGTATLSVFPLGGFSQAVQFTCGTLPTNVTCSFSPAQVTPDGVHPSNVTLTLNTSGTLAKNSGKNNLWAVTSTFALAGILLPFGRRKGWKLSLAAFCLIAVALCGSGCGSGSGSTSGSPTGAPVGSFTITVSTRSASVSAAKTVTLSVNIVK